MRRLVRHACILNLLVTLPVSLSLPISAEDNVDSTTQAQALPTQVWNIGIVLTAQGGPCRGIFACTPVPRDFSDQRVRIVARDVSKSISKLRFHELGSGARLMVVDVSHMRKGDTVRAVLSFEVEKQALPAPSATAELKLPRRPSRQVRSYLRPSPFIESEHSEIVSLAHTFASSDDSDWSRIESIYDWVRNNVNYVDSDLKGALAALRDGNGDCEEMTSLFIALCRANDIPARTVWVPGHCYPEFYLLDHSGHGRWYPCQAAGQRAFGKLDEQRPILQKGDSFHVPRSPQNQLLRYAQLVGSQPGAGLVHPQVTIVHEQVKTVPTAAQ